ncbi:MAG TPA: helix-turn-helix domain-containing protein [Polyangiaceae bacterium LLY-WYZ-14_1]|nr:helix-turn-helix domain-containing protein [Polyangiaceae bacterium LLY-WYZ-14_1]
MEDADALVLSAKTFEQMVQSHSEIAVRLITKLARRLDAADTLVEILLHRDPRARVVLALRREAELRGRVQDDGSVLLPLGTDELAEQVGLAPDEVNEVLLRLARHDLVAQDLPGLVVPDPLRLHEFSQSLEPRG